MDGPNQTMPGITMLAAAAAVVVHQGVQDVVSLVMATGALLAGVASLLPALSKYQDGRQLRRHRAEVHRAEMRRRREAPPLSPPV